MPKRRNEMEATTRPEPFTYKSTYGTDGVIYEGWAVPGSAASDAVWLIALNEYTSGNLTSTTWAGSASFDQIWDNRASLSYS